MPQEIPECREENRDTREHYRAEMYKLTVLNGAEKIIAAMKVARGVFSNLKPYQPPDFTPLVQHLEQVGFNVGEQSEYATNVAADILTSAYILDKRRWHQILSEWEA